MLKTLLELFRLLNRNERRGLVKLQILVSLMSVTELVSIASIGPFMAIVARPEIIESNFYLSQLYVFFGCDTEFELLIIIGLGVLLMLSFSGVLALITNWQILRFGARLGADLGTRLFTHYMQKNWLYHTSTHSAKLIQKVAAESNRTTQLIIQPSLMMASKILLVLVITFGIFFLNPTIAFVGLCLFATAYTVIFRVIKHRLVDNGEKVTHYSRQLYLTLSEGFGGIKDTLIYNKQEHFTQEFKAYCTELAKLQSINQFLSISPRYIIEIIAFTAVILLLTYLIYIHQGDLTNILPIISIYGLAGFKMMPALQKVFFCLAQIKANIPGFNNIKSDMQEFNQYQPPDQDCPVSFERELLLQGVCFTYPGKEKPAIDNISLSIKPGQHVAFVGPSGSGKSTLVDLILGLIDPDSGAMLVDGEIIRDQNRAAWQRQLGYVPQSIYLSDKSIRANIAFGESDDSIDENKLAKAANLAHVNEFADRLVDNLETTVGERGAQLSGGQRQRIGIARALYNSPVILIFDEATSALDGITEKAILESIEELSGDRTIIVVAHRLSTVEKCDVIYFIEDGGVSDKGSYQELLENNGKFRLMASQNDAAKSAW